MRRELLEEIVACPSCKQAMADLQCRACGLGFPVVGTVPVLISGQNSIFDRIDFTENRDTTYRSGVPQWKRFLKRFIPSVTLSVRSRKNFERLRELLEERPGCKRVLVIGGAVEGEGMEGLTGADNVEFVGTDIAFGPQTDLVCDAHDLAFIDGSFDAVIVQAVLEHVIDPFRCVDEIVRVLKPDGLVYAETPFMAPVHAGRYDFLRFSHLAHRRLFRRFREIESGAACGPGTALAWSYCYFLQSFAAGETGRQLAFAFASFTGFWLKYFDYFLIDRPGSYDAALSYYFLGEMAGSMLGDRELIRQYRGSYP